MTARVTLFCAAWRCTWVVLVWAVFCTGGVVSGDEVHDEVVCEYWPVDGLELRSAINAAAGCAGAARIQLATVRYALNGSVDVTTHVGGLTFNGNGGEVMGGLFQLQNGRMWVSNVSFLGDGGIGVFNSGNEMFVSNCTFSNAFSHPPVMVTGISHLVGLRACQVTRNAIIGVYVRGTSHTVNIISSSFSGNTASGVFADVQDSNMNISLCSFVGQMAANSSMSVAYFQLSKKTQLSVSDSLFGNNTASLGALYVLSSGESVSTIDSSHFKNNRGGSMGGGLFANINDFASHLVLVKCNFFLNTVNIDDGLGGGAYLTGYGTATISNSVFRRNQATAGSSLYLWAQVRVSIIDTKVLNNSGGGALYAVAAYGTSMDIKVLRCYFAHNAWSSVNSRAFPFAGDSGVAVFVYGEGSVGIYDSVFLHNFGPAENPMFKVNGLGLVLNMSGCLFSGQNKGSLGGIAMGLYLAGRVVARVTGSNFTDLTTFTGGSGVYMAGLPEMDIALSHCNFINNAAVGLSGSGVHGVGGAVAVSGVGRVRLQGCKFFNNSARNAGGGCWLSLSLGLDMALSDCNFIDNTLTGRMSSGAGLSVQGIGVVVVSQSKFFNNGVAGGDSSGAGIGAISTGTGHMNLTVVECIFVNNTAFMGASVSVDGPGTFTLSGCTFEGLLGLQEEARISTLRTYVFDSVLQNSALVVLAGRVDVTNSILFGNVTLAPSCELFASNVTMGGTVHASAPIYFSNVKLLQGVQTHLVLTRGSGFRCTSCVFTVQEPTALNTEGSLRRWKLDIEGAFFLTLPSVIFEDSLLSFGEVTYGSVLSALTLLSCRVSNMIVSADLAAYLVTIKNSTVLGSALNLMNSGLSAVGTSFDNCSVFIGTGRLIETDGVLFNAETSLNLDGSRVRLVRSAFCNGGRISSSPLLVCGSLFAVDQFSLLPSDFRRSYDSSCGNFTPIVNDMVESVFGFALCGTGSTTVSSILRSSVSNVGLKLHAVAFSSLPLLEVIVNSSASSLFQGSAEHLILRQSVQSGTKLTLRFLKKGRGAVVYSSRMIFGALSISELFSTVALSSSSFVVSGRGVVYDVFVSFKSQFDTVINVNTDDLSISASHGTVTCDKLQEASLMRCGYMPGSSAFSGWVTLSVKHRTSQESIPLSGGFTVVWIGVFILVGVVVGLAFIVPATIMTKRYFQRRQEAATARKLSLFAELKSFTERHFDNVGFEENTELLDRDLFIEESGIKHLRDVASGASGKVALAQWRGFDVAVKTLYLQDKEAIQEWAGELRALRDARHPNVLQLYGAIKDPLGIVTEFMHRGSLLSVLETTRVSWPSRLQIATDIARGMAFLHDKGIAHRDLKSLNVFLAKDFRAKVGDLGASNRSGTSMHTAKGTLMWMAPEVFDIGGDNSLSYDRRSDIYSFGIVLWELWTCSGPYSTNKDVPQGMRRFMQFVEEGGRPTIPDGMPGEYQNLVERCWSKDPNERPPFSELVANLHRMTISELEKDGEASGSAGAGEPSLGKHKSAVLSWLSRNLKSFTSSRKTQMGGSMKIPLIQIQ